jgi:hypothetical protein
MLSNILRLAGMLFGMCNPTGGESCFTDSLCLKPDVILEIIYMIAKIVILLFSKP